MTIYIHPNIYYRRSKYHTLPIFSRSRVIVDHHMSFCQTGRPVACAQCAFDPCYARATVVRARFLAAALSDGSYLAHVNDAYLRHVTFCIVRGPPLFICSSSRLPLSVGPLAYAAPCPLTVPGWSKVHDGDVEGVEQTCSRIQPASPILV